MADQTNPITSETPAPPQPPVETTSASRKFLNYFDSLDKADKGLVKVLSLCSGPDKIFGFLRPFMKGVEMTGHGAMWLIIVPALFFISGPDRDFKEKLLNFQLALLLDIVIVAILKGLIRRPRPEMNLDDQDTILVDKYSMPSGHAARAILILIYVYKHFNIGDVYFELLRIWVIFIFGSRILMARHYPSDLLVGVIVGFLESFLIGKHLIWVSLQTLIDAIGSENIFYT